MAIVKLQQPLTRSLNSLLDEFWNDKPATFRPNGQTLHYPSANILEQEGQYQILISVPGLEKSDISIKTEQNLLHISTEKKEASENGNCLRREFEIKPFKRSFSLDETIDIDKISAVMENGILKLELPRKNKQVRQIEVR